ncbi:MAG: hypothetical protein K9J16_08075 [Melioribacteraceae bacterium]|nr:hypothetical protein [Melioribacteraceae bacterium]MCF8353859.1 hypothetical protein [Melioribacteraceae bacterium]MCF8393092.1 hypothetical protein [Melioribacteraceae bacterium]MCF8419211.1 hypothetical protein [Melioribacteraceae bacterium]
MIKYEETSTEKPKCPHCEKEITKILSHQVESTFGKRYVYFCEVCKKVLGVSHRKGFWMG